MTADRRTAFVEWARRARAKPTFDLEERDYRLAVAAAVRALMDAAQSGRPLRDKATALVKRLLGSEVSLIAPRHLKPLHDWAETDDQGLGRALRDFSEHDDPVDRIGRFEAAIAAGPLAGRFAAGGPIVAPLLNFGLSPETLPIAHPARYGKLRQLLGEGPIDSRSAAETYRDCLAFASAVDQLLRAAGVPVRDMIDVDSLIRICVVEQDLWAGNGIEPGSRRTTQPDTYLAIGALIRNPGRYLAEWLEFHRLVGVERFFLYDNESDDEETRETLASYADDGLVVVHDWPGSVSENYSDLVRHLRAAYMDCIRAHGQDARWIAFIDTDEFLFPPTGRPLPELLVEFERWPAVAAGWVLFGTSGHLTPPPGLVIESYTQRFARDGSRRMDRHIKSIVDPLAVTACLTSHVFSYAWGAAVDENGYPVLSDTTKARSIERIRINHYCARSEQEVRAKHRRRATHSLRRSPAEGWRPDDDLEEVVRRASAPGPRDEVILRYAPAVREALAERAVVK